MVLKVPLRLNIVGWIGVMCNSSSSNAIFFLTSLIFGGDIELQISSNIKNQDVCRGKIMTDRKVILFDCVITSVLFLTHLTLLSVQLCKMYSWWLIENHLQILPFIYLFSSLFPRVKDKEYSQAKIVFEIVTWTALEDGNAIWCHLQHNFL